MGVMMQAFHWDCPRVDGHEFGWWDAVRARVPALAAAGFTALWLPPAHKAGNIGGPSMGYDPYDYYDLGEFDQKGSVPTWFGTRQALASLINDAHAHRMQVLADFVINHNNGADAQEQNPIDHQWRWTKFAPASGRFPRSSECFHPSRFDRWDDGAFGEMPDLDHRNPYVYGEVLELARWLIEEIGFDGFRYDFVKGYGAWLITAIQEYRYERAGRLITPFGVGENWSSDDTIAYWVQAANQWNDNPVSAFDFPLRGLLKALCDQPGFDLRAIPTWPSFARLQPERAVTFVENHDLRDEGQPIVHDKLMAYSFMLTHEGYPCVFWKDYVNYGLALPGTPHGIDALVSVHERLAGGRTEVLLAEQDLYIMQRTGAGSSPGLVYVLNNRGDVWNGAWVTSRFGGATLKPWAWWSATDQSQPSERVVAADGRTDVWAPPRGYCVYGV